jgi:beta-lactamase class A
MLVQFRRGLTAFVCLVSMRDRATGERVQHRANERILMCSTFKALAATLVLLRADRGQEKLDRRIEFSRKDVVAPARL